MCCCQLHLHVQKALRLQVTWRMITFAFQMREMRPAGFARSPMSAQAALAVRTEDASVSHDRILTTGGYRGVGSGFNGGITNGVSFGALTERLPLRFADALEVAG